MEVEIRKCELQQQFEAGHLHISTAQLDCDKSVRGLVKLLRVNPFNKTDRLPDPLLKLRKALFGIWKAWALDVGKPADGSFRCIAGALNLARQRKHIRCQPRVY